MTDTEETQQETTSNVSHLAMRSRYGDLPIGEAVTLYDGNLVLRGQNGTTTLTGTGKVTFEFVPDTSVQFVMEANQHSVSSLMNDDLFIEMEGLKRAAKVQVLDSHRSLPSGEIKASGILTEQLRFKTMKPEGSPEPVCRVQFHVVNFHEYLGESICRQIGTTQRRWSGRAQFEFDRWEVTLDTVPDQKERQRQVKAQGGLAVTHIGNLRQKDGRLFAAQEADEILEFLYWFLSFINGARCPCILSSGLGYIETPLSEDWTPWLTRSGKSSLSWFARNLPKECFSIAENFYSFWRDNDKRDWLTLAISIYTDSNSNTSGTDLELTKAQIALEMLCWIVLLEENAVISGKRLEKLSAAARIRMLLSASGIPLSIPVPLGDLNTAFVTTPGADGPQATTEVRNSVVHPTKKNRAKSQGYSNIVKFEAWQLNMWYVELVMLKLFGYTGHYNNRLDRTSWAGKYEPVPWAQSTPSS